jgi:hypothetical protein
MTKITPASKMTVTRKGKVSTNKTDSLPIPSQNLHMDPRGKTSYRARGSYIAQGDKVTVKGTKTRKPVTATWF